MKIVTDLERILDAFVTRDTELARRVCGEDADVDALKEQIFRELLTFMMEDPKTIPRSIPSGGASACAGPPGPAAVSRVISGSTYAMAWPCAPITRSGTGNTLSRRTVEPAPRASAATTGTMPSLCSRPSIGVRIRLAIVARLRRVVISALLGRRRRGQRFRRTRERKFRESLRAPRASHAANATIDAALARAADPRARGTGGRGVPPRAVVRAAARGAANAQRGRVASGPRSGNRPSVSDQPVWIWTDPTRDPAPSRRVDPHTCSDVPSGATFARLEVDAFRPLAV